MVVNPYTHAVVKNCHPWTSGKFKINVALKKIENQVIFDRDQYFSLYLEVKKKIHQGENKDYFPDFYRLTDDELSYVNQKLMTYSIGIEGSDINSMKSSLRDIFHHLCMNRQEDIAIWKREGNREWLAGLHISFPNHWAPDKKIGASFFDVHRPVPQIDMISKMALKFFDQACQRGPQFRLAWGLSTDTCLHHHPKLDPPGRAFNPDQPKLYIRLERQTLLPLEIKNILIFTIRTYFIDVGHLLQDDKKALHSALLSMDDKILSYKGLKKDLPAIKSYLETFIK